MSFFEFVQWCFRSPLSGFVTLIAMMVAFDGAANIVAALRGGR